MERREKTEFILEQMRLLIAVARSKDAEKGVEGKKDAVVGGEAEWVKVRVGGRKVNESFLTQPENEVCGCISTVSRLLTLHLGIVIGSQIEIL